jgi:hypothetical protein
MNLKFRVYDIEEKKYLTNNEIESMTIAQLRYWKYKIEFYTGKVDLGGNKIYVGDIVQLESSVPHSYRLPAETFGRYEVVWRKNSFQLKVLKKGAFDTWFITREEAEKRTIDPRCPAIAIEYQPLQGFNICRIVI